MLRQLAVSSAQSQWYWHMAQYSLVLWYASSDSLYWDDFNKSNQHSLLKHILQRHFNDLFSKIKPLKQPNSPGGHTREGSIITWASGQVLLMSGALEALNHQEEWGGGRGQPPWKLTKGYLHQGRRDLYTAVTSPHSRGLRHNHAWHGGERGHIAAKSLPMITETTSNTHTISSGHWSSITQETAILF